MAKPNTRFNIAERAYTVRLRNRGTELSAVFWATDKKALRERLNAEFPQEIEVVEIQER